MLRALRRARCSWSLRHRAVTMLVSCVVTLVATVYLFVIIPKGFIPSEDTGPDLRVHRGRRRTSPSTRWCEHQQAVADIVAQQTPTSSSSCPRSAPAAPARRQHRPHLHARSSRATSASRTADEIIQELRPKLATVPGIHVYLQNPAAHPHRRPAHQEPVPVHAAGRRSRTSSTSGRRSCTSEAARAARASGRDHRSADHQPAGRRSRSTATRPSALGVTADQIENALCSAYGRAQVSTIYTPTNQYWVILELDPQYQRDPGRALAALRALRQRRSWCRSTPWPTLTPASGR